MLSQHPGPEAEQQAGKVSWGGETTEIWGNETAGEEPDMETGVWPMWSGAQEDWGGDKGQPGRGPALEDRLQKM